MAKAKRLTPKQIDAIIAEASEQWLEQHDESGIRSWVRGTLDRNRDEILHKGLGFEKDAWSGWRIDHRNGRMSVISEHVKETAMDEAQKWLTEQCGALPTLNKQEIAALRNEYRTTYYNSLKERLRGLAVQRASVRASELLSQFTTTEESGAKQ
jgi:hypothetical protein